MNDIIFKPFIFTSLTAKVGAAPRRAAQLPALAAAEIFSDPLNNSGC